ncbi:MBL fold metallo-hydrolase [Rathayibacter sp. ZW T2_19]|uniref:MBL fold metallo-hydrolase n=1 Tax=Rathayibacter rubneri TaxID=2950106 RepID=A0A9X2IQH2_9MICO|nr:MBL fold metallo-hydrolase [Rathayibacter rubneri]MCM6761170.1 MBL fold metallo-hydrolase [Rathayibacter rubneri]
MYEVDFLPVENEDGDSSKSGDAIALRFTVATQSNPAVVVVDGGFGPVGDALVDHVEQYYGTSNIDLVISTHPDTDHINGLIKVLERCQVGELMMHLPWLHNASASSLGNYEKIVQLYDLAVEKGVTVTEPFTGTARFGEALRILGPSKGFYEEQLAEAVAAASETAALSARSFGATLLAKATKLLERTRSLFPVETLTDADETSARNKMSVVTLVQVDGENFMLTGDAGIPTLNEAAEEYERVVGPFSSYPLTLFQAPHHGSHRNLGPAILDRILGPKDAAFNSTLALISSAKASEKHPSPKVTNALGRRGAIVAATEGRTITHMTGHRDGWGPITPIGPLEEEDL